MKLEDMSREELISLVQMYAKNWLAHDGCWFQAIERERGMDEAMYFDTEAWKRFSPIEAKRIMSEFNIPPNGGLDALEKALNLRLYASINIQHSERAAPNKLIFVMDDCRVQTARRRKNMDDFPCKPVGIVEYSTFAETIDLRIKTECIRCPPDPCPEGTGFCMWGFTIEDETS
ncbi:MAG: DUF6125 family protein [Candidatus Hodarchaeota archaeon]